MQYLRPAAKRLVLVSAMGAAFLATAGHASVVTQGKRSTAPPKVQLDGRKASPDIVRTINWVLASGDNRGAPVIMVDKRRARVYVFESRGQLLGSSPVLLGLAKGDHTVPGIGDKPLREIKTEERTTPAGRFVAEPGRNVKGEDIVWVDYEAAVSMHRVRAVSPAERRLERLASPTPRDNRISYGCINVPVEFYENVLSPAAHRDAVIYVLPETRPAASLFGFRVLPSGGRPAPAKQVRAKPATGSAQWPFHLLDGA